MSIGHVEMNDERLQTSSDFRY